MKGVKTVLSFVLGAAYASGWWAGIIWFPASLVVIPVVSTFLLLVFCLWWLVENWEYD